MAKFIIVKKEDLSIQGSYDADQKDDTSDNRSYLHAEPICMHLEMPSELDPECVKCEDGAIIADSAKVAAKVQAGREAKLNKMRSQRAAKIAEVDIMVNELALGKRVDTSAVSDYRDALLAITDDYKDENGAATADIDALAADLSDLSWATKP